MSEIIFGVHSASEVGAIGDYVKELAERWHERGWIEPVMRTREIVDSLAEMVDNPGVKYDETFAVLFFCSYLVDKGYASSARYLGDTIVLDKLDTDEEAWETASIEFGNC